MSDLDGPVTLLSDANLLMRAFAENGWESATIRVGESEIAFCRGTALGGLGAKATVGTVRGETTPVAVIGRVCAPHVGTVVGLAEVGSFLGRGERVASLAVLEEVRDVPAAADGTVLSHSVKPGMLVEFGQLLAELGS